MKEDHSILHLHPTDNIIVVICNVTKDSTFVMDGKTIIIRSNIELGHKVAIKEIEPGVKIIKCGTFIGSATKMIRPGEHVHLHNMKSNYLPTYTLKDEFNG